MSKLDDIARIFREDVEAITRQAAAGTLDPRAFKAWMSEAIEEYNVAALRASSGVQRIRDFPTATLDALDAHLDRQTSYLNRFVAEWEAAGGNAAAWKNAYNHRAQQYTTSIKVADGLGQGVVRGRAITLPAVPGDGSTICGQACKCKVERVDIDPARGIVEVYWRLGRSEHCRDCERRAGEWNPLRFEGWQVAA